MSKLVRALVWSALATGAAALLVNRLKPDVPRERRKPGIEEDALVDAETFTPEQQQHLSDELSGML